MKNQSIIKVFVYLIFLTFCESILAQGKIRRNNQRSVQETSTNLSVSGSLNGHDYVDLGLPSGNLWATNNVGASSPIDSGDYFAWAEISPKEEYSIFTSISHRWRFYELTTDVEKEFYIKAPVNDIIGDKRYDGATANWGSEWHLPSKEEYDELVSKCTWKLITLHGKKGFIVTGPNGNKIFFPLAGWIEESRIKPTQGSSKLYGLGKDGYYWTGDQEDLSYALSLCLQYKKVSRSARSSGRNIRAVTNKNPK